MLSACGKPEGLWEIREADPCPVGAVSASPSLWEQIYPQCSPGPALCLNQAQRRLWGWEGSLAWLFSLHFLSWMLLNENDLVVW